MVLGGWWWLVGVFFFVVLFLLLWFGFGFLSLLRREGKVPVDIYDRNRTLLTWN